MNTRKAISPVVATALLIVVVVVGVVGFQTWFNTYSSDLFIATEQQSETDAGIELDSLIGNNLYIKSSRNVSLNKISIGDTSCDLNVSLEDGINSIDVSSCLENITGTQLEVFVQGNNSEITSKYFFRDDSGTSNSGNGTSGSGGGGGGSSLSLSCETDSDGDGFFNYSCAIYPMNETLTLEGQLDPDDSVSQVQPDTSCVWSNNKNESGCLDNYIDNGCGSETVLDAATGLCWDKNFNRAGTLNWTNAKQYCLDLNDGGDPHPSGNSDWYLPSRQEFMTIIDLSRSSSPQVVGGNSIFDNLQSLEYWTRTDYIPATSNAFGFYLVTGSSYDIYNKGSTKYVACVRRN